MPRAGRHRVVRVAVALRCGVGVVQVGQGCQVGCPEVLSVQAERVLVELVREAHQGRFAVLGVDPRPRERAVEAVDGARRQRPLARGNSPAGRIERERRPACPVDRHHLRGGEGVDRDLIIDLVDDGVRKADLARPDLVRPVPQRVLLAESRAGCRCEIRRLHRAQRRRDEQLVGEGSEDQRAGRERFDVELVCQGHRRGRERTVGREQPALREKRTTHPLYADQRDTGSANGPQPQQCAAGHPVPHHRWLGRHRLLGRRRLPGRHWYLGHNTPPFPEPPRPICRPASAHGRTATLCR